MSLVWNYFGFKTDENEQLIVLAKASFAISCREWYTFQCNKFEKCIVIVLNDAIDPLQEGVSVYRIVKYKLMINVSTTYHFIRCLKVSTT